MAVRVLFISSHNSARSQMAEALLRELGGPVVEVASAGSIAFGVDPRAMLVMAELGIDITSQRSHELQDYMGEDGAQRFDYLITVCEKSDKLCPAFPGRANREYWPFKDPARPDAEYGLGHGEADADDDGMGAFREVRDQIEARVKSWLEAHRRVLYPRRRSPRVAVGS